jgi:hypothetical protein
MTDKSKATQNNTSIKDYIASLRSYLKITPL